MYSIPTTAATVTAIAKTATETVAPVALPLESAFACSRISEPLAAAVSAGEVIDVIAEVGTEVVVGKVVVVAGAVVVA